MTQPSTHTTCPVVVLAINETQILGDDMSEALRDQLLSVATQSQAQNVVLDFQQVKYLSSAGFRPLLSLHKALRQQNGSLKLARLSPEVHEVFEVTRLISSKGYSKAPFEVYPDVPSAVASLYQTGDSAPCNHLKGGRRLLRRHGEGEVPAKIGVPANIFHPIWRALPTL